MKSLQCTNQHTVISKNTTTPVEFNFHITFSNINAVITHWKLVQYLCMNIKNINILIMINPCNLQLK